MHTWEDNIKMCVEETECFVCIRLAQNVDQWLALVNTIMNF
jgi:hypothetical protein